MLQNCGHIAHPWHRQTVVQITVHKLLIIYHLPQNLAAVYLAEIRKTCLRTNPNLKWNFLWVNALIQKVIYNLGHKRRKARRELLQKSLQNSHSRITGPPSLSLLFGWFCFVVRGLYSRRPRKSTMRLWQTVSGYSLPQQADGLPNTKSKDVAMLSKTPQWHRFGIPC